LSQRFTASRPTASPNQMAPKPSSSNSAAASCIWVAGRFSNCVVLTATDPSCIDDCANAQLFCRREQYSYAGCSIGDPERPYATSFGRTGNRSRASLLKRSPPVSNPGPCRISTVQNNPPAPSDSTRPPVIPLPVALYVYLPAKIPLPSFRRNADDRQI
jgi:hypothetical protein